MVPSNGNREKGPLRACVRSGAPLHLASGLLASFPSGRRLNLRDFTFNYAMDENGRDITYPGMDAIATAALKGNVIVYFMLHLSSKLSII